MTVRHRLQPNGVGEGAKSPSPGPLVLATEVVRSRSGGVDIEGPAPALGKVGPHRLKPGGPDGQLPAI